MSSESDRVKIKRLKEEKAEISTFLRRGGLTIPGNVFWPKKHRLDSIDRLLGSIYKNSPSSGSTLVTGIHTTRDARGNRFNKK